MADLNSNQYVDNAGVKARYGSQFLIQITNFNDDDTFTTINDTNLDRAINDASDIMDGFLVSQVATPVDPAPDYFAPDCATITVGLLVERKGYISDSAEEKCVDAKKDIIKKFKAISEGKLALSPPDSGGESVAENNTIGTAPKKLFDENVLNKY